MSGGLFYCTLQVEGARATAYLEGWMFFFWPKMLAAEMCKYMTMSCPHISVRQILSFQSKMFIIMQHHDEGCIHADA